jgi:hypothetical protein
MGQADRDFLVVACELQDFPDWFTMSQEILLAADCRSPQLCELRGLANGIERRVLLHRWIGYGWTGAALPGDRLSQQPDCRIPLSAEGQVLGVLKP